MSRVIILVICVFCSFYVLVLNMFHFLTLLGNDEPNPRNIVIIQIKSGLVVSSVPALQFWCSGFKSPLDPSDVEFTCSPFCLDVRCNTLATSPGCNYLSQILSLLSAVTLARIHSCSIISDRKTTYQTHGDVCFWPDLVLFEKKSSFQMSIIIVKKSF